MEEFNHKITTEIIAFIHIMTSIVHFNILEFFLVTVLDECLIFVFVSKIWF